MNEPILTPREKLTNSVTAMLDEMGSKIKHEPIKKYKELAKVVHTSLVTHLTDFSKPDSIITNEELQENLKSTITNALPQFNEVPTLMQMFQNALKTIANFFRPLTSKFGFASAQSSTMFRSHSDAIMKTAKKELAGILKQDQTKSMEPAADDDKQKTQQRPQQ